MAAVACERPAHAQRHAHAQLAACSPVLAAEGPHLVVPKIALLVAVASHLGVERITYRRSIGGCAGLMALGDFVEL